MEDKALLDYLKSPEFVKASTNVTRLVGKLESAIQRKELYETHQILRTINFRFINSTDKIVALKNLLFEGTCYLLKSGENVSGQDIGTLFLDSAAKFLQKRRDESNEETNNDLTTASLTYHANNNTLDYDICQKVAHIAISLPETEIGQPKFIADALKILNPKILNRSLLHEVLATKFWQIGDLSSSRYHYLHCASLLNAKDVASLLVSYQTGSANRSEVDLFITQFILQFLCLQTPIDPPDQKKATTSVPSSSSVNHCRRSRGVIKSIAEKIFSSYTLQHPSLSQVCVPFSSLPLLNFTYFIITILDSDKEASTFVMLRDIYKVTWSRDPNYNGYLTRIETLYFGINDQAKQRQGGFFNNILLSLLEGPDDEDNDSNQDGNNLSSCDELD